VLSPEDPQHRHDRNDGDDSGKQITPRGTHSVGSSSRC
jgi:hypothetical protein